VVFFPQVRCPAWVSSDCVIDGSSMMCNTHRGHSLSISWAGQDILLKTFLKRTISKNKSLILRESKGMQNFMKLLMKQRNTGINWTTEDIGMIKSHLIHLSLYVPVLIIFLLPFGSLLLPVLAEIIDRREEKRKKEANGLSNPDIVAAS